MDFFDQRLPQRLSRYPALAEHEDGPPPYDEYAPYDEPGSEFDDAGGQNGRGGRQLPAAAVTGLLGVAVATGVANFAAAFLRSQASPVSAVGGAFIDHVSPALRHFGVQRSGGNDKDMLLLGLSAAIALIAAGTGILAWRRPRAGLAGIGLLGLFAACVAVTRPGGRATDAIPSVVGALAALAIVAWLVRTGTPHGAGATARASDGYEPAGYEPPAYEPTAYQPPAYEPAAYQPPAYEPAAFEPAVSAGPAYRNGWSA